MIFSWQESGTSYVTLRHEFHGLLRQSYTCMCILDPSPLAFKQCQGTYFYYNYAAIGLACAQATAVRIDVAPHTRPR